MDNNIENFKYCCEICNYKCKYQAHWKQHLDSDKHNNNGKRKTRCDKLLEPKCNLCSFTTNNLTNMKVHKLTKHSTVEDRQTEFKFYCLKCDFGTFAEILYNRHLTTNKHMLK